MIFSQYKETCEVLLDHPKIGGEDMKYYVKTASRNILHTNIDVHSKRLIYYFPVYGANIFSSFNIIVEIRLLMTTVDMIGFFNRSHIKEGNHQ